MNEFGLKKQGFKVRELKILFKLALPSIIITISRTLMTFVDFAIVSALGTNAQAAITPAFLSVMVIMGLGMGTVSIISTYASQALGRNSKSEASIYCWQSIYFSILCAIIVLPLIPFVEFFMSFYGHDPEVLKLEVQYTQITFLSMFPSVAAYALQNFFVGIQRPLVSMVATIIANLFNAICCYVLVFGKFGFPEMGFQGAAWGIVMSTFLQLWILLYAYFSKKYDLIFQTRSCLYFNKARFLNLIKFGIPAGLTWINDLLAWTIFIAVMVGKFGPNEMAASNIAFQLMRISFMPAIGLGQALSSLVGSAIGECKFYLAHFRTNLGCIVCVAWMGVCGIVFFIFGEELIALFNNNATIIQVGGKIMICLAIFQIFDAIAIAISNGLRGAGDTFWPTVLMSLVNWVIFVPFGILITYLAPQWGSVGPWSISTVSVVLIGIILYVRFIRGAWKKIDIFYNKAV